MTTNPVFDAEAHIERIDAYTDAMHAAEAEIEAEIMRLVFAGDMSAIVHSAPMVDKREYSLLTGACFTSKRCQTLAEVLFDSLDFMDGPTFHEILALLRKAPGSWNLFNRMARQFAGVNAYVDES